MIFCHIKMASSELTNPANACEDYSSFPVKIKKGATHINGHHTDVAISEFEDKLFMIITQFEKIGTMINVSQEVTQEGSLPIYHIATIFGKDDIELHTIARMLAEKLQSNKPILLAIALKEISPEISRNISQYISELCAKR